MVSLPYSYSIKLRDEIMKQVMVYKKCDKDKIRKWESEAYAKVVVKAPDLETLFVLKEMAKKNDIANYLVTDAGRTQVPESTITVLGLGPDEDEILDKLTGDLKLL